MRVDPRCKKLNELSDRYHQLFNQLGERYVLEVSRELQLKDTLCFGDYLFLYIAGDSERNTVSMAEASRNLGVNPSTATRRVNKLLNSGLVTKAQAAYDERRYDIGLTDRGREVLESVNDRLYMAIQKTYEDVTEEELQTVYQYMDKCIGKLKGLVSGRNV